jgi:AbrB family looped-hinge helix DNA binding protein
MKTDTIQIDKAGRVVLPKPLRDQFNLVAGDKLQLSVDGGGFRLEPTEGGGKLVKKGSVLVFVDSSGEPVTAKMVNEILEKEREGRITAGAGKIRKK